MKDSKDYKVLFQKECGEWSHEYASVAITNATMDAVIEVAKEYAEKHAFYDFESCFDNGKDKDGVISFTAFRESPSKIADFFSGRLPDSVVYAGVSWDYHEIYVRKNGKEYNGFTAKWVDDEKPEGYKEWGEEDEETYYNCNVVLIDNETGYKFYTGGGMCSEREFNMFCHLICS